MDCSLKEICIHLIFFIATIEATGIDKNDTSPDENHRSPGRGRIIKQYSGTRPEPIVCIGEGFETDPHNCGTFYRCVKSGNGKFTVFRFQCGPGTVFDPDQKVCNHPQNTKRSECGGMSISPPVTDDRLVYMDTEQDNEIQVNMYNEIPSPMVPNNPIYTQSLLQNSTITDAKVTSPSNSKPFTTERAFTSTSANLYPLGSSMNPIYIDWNTMVEKPLSTESNVPHPISRDNICTSDGFMGDSENCRKFYRCVANQSGGFTRFEFSCAETTIWDDYNQICNYIWAVRRTRCNLLSDKIAPPNLHPSNENSNLQEKNSSKQHIRENIQNNAIQEQLQIGYGSKVTQTQNQVGNGFVNQNQTQINYGDQLHKNKNHRGGKQNQTQISYDSATSQLPTQINYGNKEVQTELLSDHSNKASQNQIQISELSTKKPSIIQVSNTQHDSTPCTEAGYIGDSKDCQKFYRCVENGQGGFKKFGFSCAQGTAWDPSLKTCNHVWALQGCTSQNSIGSTTHSLTTTTTYKTTQSYYATMSTENDSKIPQIAVMEDNEDIGYENLQPQTTPTSSLSTTLTNASDTKGTECKSSGFMGDDNDCKIFYRCVENSNGGFTKHVFYCGQGTVWDSEITACNHEWAVEKCGGNAFSDINTINAITEKPTTSVSVPIQTTTATQVLTELSPNNDYNDNDVGYGSSNNDVQTTTISTKYPSITIPIDNICKSSGFIGDRHDCTKFYRCVDNGKGGFIHYEFTCSKGTLWDSKINACNYASAVGRCGETTEIHKDQDGYDVSSTVIFQTTTTTSKPVITTTSTSESMIIDGSKCTQSGFIGDSNDCKKFYRCVDDGNGSYKKFDFMCGDGTLWDEEIKSCNHAWAVKKCGFNSASSHVNDELSNEYPSNVNSDSNISSTTLSIFSTSTEISQQPLESDLCVSSGFFGDINHCEKFYRCVDNGQGKFTRYDYVCGDGTVWDQSITACNHAWAVKECNNVENSTKPKPSEITTEFSMTTPTVSGSSSEVQNISDIIYTKNETDTVCTTEGFIADPNNCKSFYRCVDDGKGVFKKYQYSCGEGTYWNQEILSCDHVTDRKTCGVKEDQVLSGTNTETTTISKDENTQHKPTPKPPSSPVLCTSEGFYGDKHDCRKFYRCVNDGKGGYTPYYFNCGDGTVWDQELEACNHETYSKCANTVSVPSQTTDSKPVYPGVSATTDQYDTSSSTLCESEGFFAVPKDCKKFVRCVNNNQGGFTKYELTCSEGTVWVQEMLICYHDSGEANCNYQPVTNDSKNEEHQQTTQIYEPSTSEQSLADKLSDENSNSDFKPLPTTNDICLSEGYYSNKKDCRKFYRCVDNGKGGYIKHDYNCGEGTAWDSSLQTCNYIDQVSSCQGSVMHDKDNTHTTESLAATSQKITSTITTTTVSSAAQKPTPNLELTQKPLTNSESQKPDKCNNEGYFGNTKDCKKFYRCVDNGKGGYTKYDFNCAEGTIWDKDITTCNHPENVVHPSCNQTQDSSTTGSSSSGSVPISTTEGNQETSKKPSNNNNCNKAGFYADPTDCKKFYRCVDWDGTETKFSIFHFECGEGTIWDPAVETCNHEDSVYPPRDCSGSQSPATEGTTTSQQENITESSTQPTSPPNTQSTTINEPTTQTAPESTTQPGTESTNLSTTESSSQSTTESTNQSTIELTESTTILTTPLTTESTTAYTTESITESTTDGSGSTEITTDQSTEGTTEQSSESTTEQLGEVTTSETTTEQLGGTTTDQYGETTTQQYGESTTEQFTESTTDNSGRSTTEKSGENTTTEVNLTTESEIETTTKKPADGDCPETNDDQNLFVCPSSFRRHPKYCNLFYQCDENEDTHELKIALFTCPNNTIYDENQTKCVEKSKAEKPCKGTMALGRRVKRKERIGNTINDPIVVTKDSYACTSAGYYAFEKDGDCSPAFLKCIVTKSNMLRGLVYQCPAGYLFWTVSRRCEPMYKVNDCRRSVINDWSRRWEIPLESKNVAW